MTDTTSITIIRDLHISGSAVEQSIAYDLAMDYLEDCERFGNVTEEEKQEFLKACGFNSQ